MTTDQIIISFILLLSLIFFIWGKWRYDVVAMGALVLSATFGLIPEDKIFSGFGHPAVVTVAAILVISYALQHSGALDAVTTWLRRFGKHPSIQILLLTAMVAVCSAFMNNVGALALFLPVTVALAKRRSKHPGSMLMPVSFASLLGGGITLIGTPPNIIISAYREKLTGDGFSMFDFTPVGLGVATVGVLYVAFIGWRFLPIRKVASSQDESLAVAAEYMMELKVGEGNKFIGRSLYRILKLSEGESVQILSIVRGHRKILVPTQYEILQENDVLIVEGQPDSVQQLINHSGLSMVEAKIDTKTLSSETVTITEAVVGPDSIMVGRSAAGLHLSASYGINLMAISRRGQSLKQRLHLATIRAGDVLLMQMGQEHLAENMERLGCLPLAEREISLGRIQKMWTTILIFAAAILVTSLSSFPSSLVFVATVGALIVFKVLNLRELYNHIEWPVIVLLAAMIPVGGALESTGTTQLIANKIVALTSGAPDYILLGILIMVSMLLSDVINNAATAVIMAPIGAGIATTLGHPIEPFLMAVCVGASSTFLTPIGHQSNLLVMSPGGYRFSDYARMGWLLDILVIITAVPLISYFWM